MHIRVYKALPKSLVKRTLFMVTLSTLTIEVQADTYASWLTQIGVNDTIMSAANWGRGLYLGVVDTGVKSTSSVFASGQISNSLSKCAAVSFKCSNGYQDDNGHGTAVAAIAAGYAKYAYNSSYGGYTVSAGSVVSVAPDANIIAEKVLNASGSGYSTDVASGIKKAADAGAAVINVSITYGNSADLVAAINYAAAKGAMIVWAGGNSAQALLNGANTSGLTAAAIQRLVFAGSVNASNTLSSFSNTPGSGSLVTSTSTTTSSSTRRTRNSRSSTTTATTTTSTAYMNRWIMAPGESILAPYIKNGSTAWAYWSGTSMSAPIISGSLILLESAWPILRTNGTAANLLLATATDLGASGIDSTYGNGLANLTMAFQPYGTLTVTGKNGTSYAVSSLTSSLITGGALGTLSSVQSKLSSYTAYDAYVRNFTVNLSSLVTSSNGSATLNPLPTNTNKGPVVVKLTGGAEFAYWQQTQELSPTANVFGSSEESQFKQGYAMMKLADGTMLSAGLGYAPQYAHQSALFDRQDIALLSLDMANTDLHTLAQGGLMSSIGWTLGHGNRLAVSWSESGQVNPLLAGLNPQANKMSVGFSHAFSPDWQAGLTFTRLHEQHGFLGSVFGANSMLGLNGDGQSQALEISSSYQPFPRHLLMAQMSLSTTRGVSADGLLAGVSDMQAQGFGLGWLVKSVFGKEDQFSLTLKQPLRLSSGDADIVLSSVDSLGLPVYRTEKVSLVPEGREIDLRLGYDTPLSKQQSLVLQAIYRHDVQHVQGVNDLNIGGMWAMKF